MSTCPRLAALIATALALPPPAWADEMADMETAMNLGRMIGAESYCGLTFDQAAIEAFIEKHVPAENMGFTSTMDMAVTAEGVEQADRSPSAKTAFCAATARSAKHYGFIAK